MAYSEKVIEHYQKPQNVGSFGTSSDVKERSDIGVGIVGVVGVTNCVPTQNLRSTVGIDLLFLID